MAETDRPLLGELRDDLAGVSDEVVQLATLRLRLAEIELRESAQAAKRLGVWVLVAVVLLLTSLPVFIVALSNWLDGAIALRLSWAWILGFLSAIGGAAIGWLALHQFRREFRGLEQSMEELREDLVWVKEWIGRQDKS